MGGVVVHAHDVLDFARLDAGCLLDSSPVLLPDVGVPDLGKLAGVLHLELGGGGRALDHALGARRSPGVLDARRGDLDRTGRDPLGLEGVHGEARCAQGSHELVRPEEGRSERGVSGDSSPARRVPLSQRVERVLRDERLDAALDPSGDSPALVLDSHLGEGCLILGGQYVSGAVNQGRTKLVHGLRRERRVRSRGMQLAKLQHPLLELGLRRVSGGGEMSGEVGARLHGRGASAGVTYLVHRLAVDRRVHDVTTRESFALCLAVGGGLVGRLTHGRARGRLTA